MKSLLDYVQKQIKKRFTASCIMAVMLLVICLTPLTSPAGKNVFVDPWNLKKYITGKEKPPENLIILLKGASVAPEGSSWWNFLMENIFPDINKISNSHISIRWYGGGVLGDETDTIRKLRMKQLHFLGVTNMGLTKMLPEFCVFELPFLFDWEPELFYEGKRTGIDYILEKLEPTASRLAKQKGYEFGGFLETCIETIATQKPLKTAEDLKKLKFWLWRGDRIREDINSALGLSAIPLELYDVAQALSTGMIDTTVVGWYVSIVLQWWPYINYVCDYPFYGYESATILFDDKMLEQIMLFFDKWGDIYGIKDGREFRSKFLEVWDNNCSKLRMILRQDDAKARARLLEEKIKEVHFPEAELEKLKEKAIPLYDELAGKKYPKELLDEILKYREEYRILKKEGKLDDAWRDKGVIPGGNYSDEWRL